MLKFQTLLPAWDKEVRVLEFGKMEIPFFVSIVVSFGQISRRRDYQAVQIRIGSLSSL